MPTHETDMLIEALKDFAFENLVPVVVAGFLLVAMFIAAFMWFPAAIPHLLKAVIGGFVFAVGIIYVSKCSFD